MASLTIGDKAPDFSSPATDGNIVSLKDYKGKKLVLYFYPKDDTSGCTKESCSFRDNLARVRKKGAEILGVSIDSVKSHQKFTEKYDLSFPLLADEGKNVVQAYGVWKEKTLYGRKFMGVVRSTFVIGPTGRILQAERKVSVAGHAEAILEAV